MMKTPLRYSIFVKRVGLLTACFSLLIVSALSATEKTSSSEKKISVTKSDSVKKTDEAIEKTTVKKETTRSKRRNRRKKSPIKNPKFDPSAKRVELFAGMEEGQFSVKVIAKDSKQGHLLIENTTDKPLTVQLPKSFVTVHVLKQMGGGGGQGGGGGGQGGGQGGGGQTQGGGAGGGQGGGGQGGGGQGGFGGAGGGQGGGGGGFFSIPAEKIVRIPYHCVCLEHGKPDPSPRKTYRLMKVEDYTKDPNLQMLIELVGMNRIDSQIAQAAVWNLTDNMSWRVLAAKQRKHLGGRRPTPYFSRAQIYHAQQLVAFAVRKVKEKQETERQGKSSPERRSDSRRGIR